MCGVELVEGSFYFLVSIFLACFGDELAPAYLKLHFPAYLKLFASDDECREGRQREKRENTPTTFLRLHQHSMHLMKK